MTGSLLRTGMQDGIGTGIANTYDNVNTDKVQFTNGNPSGILWCPVYSGIALDLSAGSIYMNISGTNWIALGSCEF